MATMTADTKTRAGGTVLPHLTARQREETLFRIDHPGQPLPPPSEYQEDIETAAAFQYTVACVQDNHRGCTVYIAPELLGQAKPCLCACHTEEGAPEGGEYEAGVFAQAAADVLMYA